MCVCVGECFYVFMLVCMCACVYVHVCVCGISPLPNHFFLRIQTNTFEMEDGVAIISTTDQHVGFVGIRALASCAD